MDYHLYFTEKYTEFSYYLKWAMTTTCKDKIIRAGMDFSIPFTVNFPLLYRMSKK